MALITSAMAAKYLQKLNEEHDSLLQKEKKSDTYTVSVQEKIEDVRPEYDCAAVQFQLPGNWKIRFGRSRRNQLVQPDTGCSGIQYDDRPDADLHSAAHGMEK